MFSLCSGRLAVRNGERPLSIALALARTYSRDPGARCPTEGSADAVAAIGAILGRPDYGLDYAAAKIALDKLIDPMVDVDRTMAALDLLAGIASDMAGPGASERTKLGAIRNLIYESGPWNDHRPFVYNHDHPLGDHLPDKLLHNYLATRRGQCVSMPILFLVLAQKLGIDMRLASAPCHVFLRYTDPSGRTFNIEATSGGHPARDEWYRSEFPMSDRATTSGLYMRTLSRRESLALMATTVLEHLARLGRHREAVRVAAVILEHNPRDAQVMVTQASSYGRLIQNEFASKYPVPFLIPEPGRSRYLFMSAMNEALFARAEALGWEPDPEWATPHIPAYPAAVPAGATALAPKNRKGNSHVR